MLQLNPALPVDTPRGPAYAHFVIDYSQEHYLLFVCFLCETGDCWVYPNRDVKLQQNVTMGIRVPGPAKPRAADGRAPEADALDVIARRQAMAFGPHSNGNGHANGHAHGKASAGAGE